MKVQCYQTIGRLSYDCYGSVLRDLESNQRSIDKPDTATGDPTTAETASPPLSAHQGRFYIGVGGVNTQGGTLGGAARRRLTTGPDNDDEKK